MRKIGEAMKRNRALLAQREGLEAELRTKEELVRGLRQQLAVKEAYVLGMLEANPNAAPTADLLDSLVS